MLVKGDIWQVLGCFSRRHVPNTGVLLLWANGSLRVVWESLYRFLSERANAAIVGWGKEQWKGFRRPAGRSCCCTSSIIHYFWWRTGHMMILQFYRMILQFYGALWFTKLFHVCISEVPQYISSRYWSYCLHFFCSFGYWASLRVCHESEWRRSDLNLDFSYWLSCYFHNYTLERRQCKSVYRAVQWRRGDSMLGRNHYNCKILFSGKIESVLFQNCTLKMCFPISISEVYHGSKEGLPQGAILYSIRSGSAEFDQSLLHTGNLTWNWSGWVYNNEIHTHYYCK